MLLEILADLARLCTRQAPSDRDILEACRLVQDALGARDAYVMRAGDPYFTRVGSETPPDRYEIKQRGYWLVWQELARSDSVPVGAFDVEERLVTGGRQVDGLEAYTHLACILPAEESNSEMLVVRGDWPAPLTPDERRFIGAARLMLASLVAAVVDAGKQARLQEQLRAVAQVARAFSEASDYENILQSVATALAQASGFDWVTISVVNDDADSVIERAMNLARHSNTETARINLRRTVSTDTIRDMARDRAPRVFPDVLSDERVTAEMVAYYQRAHILSTATMPMVFQGGLLGFVVFSSSTRHTFAKSELNFLEDLVSQAATTIKGVRLYRELEGARQIQHFLARTDPLTGIPNRRYFEEVLGAEFARAQRYHEPLCVLMADLDHFKAINDSLGHHCGDEALRHVAGIARERCRESDFVGRWGGDEYVFILPNTAVDGGVAFARRLVAVLKENPYLPAGEDSPLPMTISIGAADLGCGPFERPSQLLEAADKALYSAKQSGRNRVVSAPSGALAA